MIPPLLVVKLGGSLAFSPKRHPWLRAAAAGAGRVVLVPGGGPFADAVRAAQAPMGFDDRAAHRMALLAMAQYGLALAALSPALALAENPAEIGRALSAGRVPVWSPWPALRDDPEVAESWDVTSDSLALLLARRLEASGLLLVKSRAPAPGMAVTAMVADALLDPAFPRFLDGFRGEVFVAGPDDARHLAEGRLSGLRVAPSRADAA